VARMTCPRWPEKTDLLEHGRRRFHDEDRECVARNSGVIKPGLIGQQTLRKELAREKTEYEREGMPAMEVMARALPRFGQSEIGFNCGDTAGDQDARSGNGAAQGRLRVWVGKSQRVRFRPKGAKTMGRGTIRQSMADHRGGLIRGIILQQTSEDEEQHHWAKEDEHGVAPCPMLRSGEGE